MSEENLSAALGKGKRVVAIRWLHRAVERQGSQYKLPGPGSLEGAQAAESAPLARRGGGISSPPPWIGDILELRTPTYLARRSKRRPTEGGEDQ